jgi:pullulanase
MYENFGCSVDQKAKTATFKLFFPDGEGAPDQYEGGGLPRVVKVSVVGSFQDPIRRRWNTDPPIPMTRADYRDGPGASYKGQVYSYTTPPLPDGFYEYKYLVEFPSERPRYLTDPCGRYGGTENQNSGFVVGGAIEQVRPLRSRLPYQDLIIYELMIDDFTASIRLSDEAPLQTVVRKLDHLVRLGINAIEFMPWTAWMCDDLPELKFSWGYNPIQYFSVAYKYINNPSTETDKLVYLKRLVNECHARDIHVIMDGVFNHADATLPDRGFPYYWLYEDPADSPYVGNFAQAAYFRDLDYANRCTLEYIRDACIYWIDIFKIDGIRFDNTLGIYKADDRGHGLPKLLSELRAYLSLHQGKNFAMILEHIWDYAAIDVTNKVGATSCWLDPYRSRSMGYLGYRPEGVPQAEPSIMRMLDSGRDFEPQRAPTIYIENHDHQRFMIKAGGRNYWYLTQPYVIALFTCAGATLIYNGQEFGLDNDMPESDPGRVIPRPLEWNLLDGDPGQSILGFYRKMIQIRRDHHRLRSNNFYPRGWDEGWTQPNPQGFGIDRKRNVVVYHRWGDDGQGQTEYFYIVLNFSGETRDVSFEIRDGGPWMDLISGVSKSPSGNLMSVSINSNWGAIYYKKESSG